MNEETLLIIENVIKSLKNWQSVCQEWEELPTLEELNTINRLMRENIKILVNILTMHVIRMN